MPIYHQEPENDSPKKVERRSYQSFACGLLHLSPIALYCSKRYLAEDIQKLSGEAFDVRTIDASKWGSGASPHDDLQASLDLPSYYGKNLNALSDCMQDLTIPDEGGMAIVLTDYDDFSRHDREFATGLLDVLAAGSRLLQIFGKTLLVLVHTKDPDAAFGKLGAVTAWWNNREFYREGRGGEDAS